MSMSDIDLEGVLSKGHYIVIASVPHEKETLEKVCRHFPQQTSPTEKSCGQNQVSDEAGFYSESEQHLMQLSSNSSCTYKL
jgi:hypothetical protein